VTVSLITQLVSLLETNNSLKKVSYAFNSPRKKRTGCVCGTHAEISAMHRIGRGRTTRAQYWEKMIRIDLMVIRVSRGGGLGNSRPCSHCIKILAGNYKLKINRIHYTDTDGMLVSTTLSKLLEDQNNGIQHVSRGYQTN